MLDTQPRSADQAPVTRQDHGRTLRLDIEGMRAIAVGAVLVFHAGLPWFPGGFVGVDVFFVLSGFLITGLLAREVSRTGRVRLGTFWARRVKRLLPASATVLAFSALITWLYLPITQREAFGGDIVSAALYVVNWRLADRSVDYLAEDVGASPVQHFWSLAVEEQFYLVWPLLILVIAVAFAKRWRLGSFLTLFVVTGLSFAWSVAQSQSSPQTAFFVSSTRIWELGIGALLALSAVRVARLPAVLRAASGWIGLAAIAFAVVAFSGSTAWPGTATLVPTVGAALVIASGIAAAPGSPQRLLSLAPMVWIGGLSYSLYLWHWPILIAAQAEFGDMRLRYTAALMVLSIIPAWLCHTYIENPVRFGSPFKKSSRALGLGAALTAVGIVIGFALNASVGLGVVVDEASTSQSLGAAAIADPANAGVVWSDLKAVESMRPLPVDAPEDKPPQYDNQPECQVTDGVSKVTVCEFGDPAGDKTVLIVGDSKILQWETALSAIAKAQGWKLLQIAKSACPFADANNGGTNYPDCHAWGKSALKEILSIKPDLVVATNRNGTAYPKGKNESNSGRTSAAMVAGMLPYWRAIDEAGIPLVGLLDNPKPTNVPLYECVAQNQQTLSKCAFSKSEGLAKSAAFTQIATARQVPGVKIVDMNDVICPDGDRCAPVIGNVLVYRQGTHLTRTYVDSAQPQLSAKLFRATGGLFGAR